MKKILILLILIIPCVKAETYYLDEKPITDLKLNIEETKKYRWYQTEKIEAFFLEGTNPKNFLPTNKYYYTAYSVWNSEIPESKNYREIIKRDVYLYKAPKKIRNIYLEVETDSEELIEFAIYDNQTKADKTTFCQGCSSDYYMHISDNNYETATKVQKLFITLDDYVEPSNFKIKVLFKNDNIKYKITIYEGKETYTNAYYYQEFNSYSDIKEIKIDEFNATEYAYGDDIIKYEKSDLFLVEQFKEYSYRDKYVLYYYELKNYYPTYETYVENYQKDENDFLIEKQYFYKEPV